jgi:hypothetical protein
MSKNTFRAKLKKAQSSKEYLAIQYNINYPIYWDDGVYFYPTYRRGYKNPNKTIERWEQRRYRTWKYNRKTQWK